ncbi:MAG TPA: CBS domain-containing protein [Nitrospira sp.]|nr:CBS domain-containing protein [Nitrospira sp.]
MQLKDVMTVSPEYCLPQHTAVQAARLMQQMDAGIVPVIVSDTDKTLLGVVTDRDLCMAVVAEGLDPKTVTLEECMSAPVVAAYLNDDTETAVTLMQKHQIRRVPIIDEAGKLVGIISTADVFQRSDVPPTKTHETLASVSRPA